MQWKNISQWLISLISKRKELDYLRKFSILSGFTNHELYLFSQILQERCFKEGEVIYQEQFPMTVIYLILKGTIELTDNYQNSNKPITLHKYQFLGIADMYNENRRQGEAIAAKDSTLLAFSHLDYYSFIKMNPRTGVKLLDNICRTLSHYILQPFKPVQE